jgi:hypothetical protein
MLSTVEIAISDECPIGPALFYFRRRNQTFWDTIKVDIPSFHFDEPEGTHSFHTIFEAC